METINGQDANGPSAGTGNGVFADGASSSDSFSDVDALSALLNSDATPAAAVDDKGAGSDADLQSGQGNKTGDLDGKPAGEDEKAAAGGEKGAEADNSTGDKTGDEAKGDGKNVPFHLHPKFREMNKTIAELKQALESRVAGDGGDKSKSAESGKAGASKLGELMAMDPDALSDLVSDDPKGFLSKLSESFEEIIEGKLSAKEAEFAAKSKEEAAVKTYESFAKKHPEFDAKWDSGEITEYMKEHPGHNAMSAYIEMTGSGLTEAQLEAAREEGRLQERKNANIKAGAKTLNGSPSTGSRPPGKDPDLANPQKFGGVTSVLANRLAARRAQSAAN